MSHRDRHRGERRPRRRPDKGPAPLLPPVHLPAPETSEPTRRPAADESRAPEPLSAQTAEPAPPAHLPLSPDLWPVMALLALAAIPFLPALSADFVWDDYALIVNNPLLRSFADIGAIFSRPFLATAPNAYHPLTTLSYLVDYQVWRLNPIGYHTTNLTLHLVATLLLFTVAVQLLRRRDMAFAATAVFAAHPVHVQSVAWIAGRSQLLATCLALFAFLAYTYYVQSAAGNSGARRRTLAYYWLAVLAFTLGLFAHAAVAGLVVLLPLYELTLARQRLSIHRQGWRLLLPYAGFVGGGILYLLARWWALGYQLAPGLEVAAWPACLYTVPLWAVRAVELLMLPVRSQPYYPVALLGTPLRLDVVTATAALAVVIALAVRARTVSPVAAFAAWWSLLTLAPALNFIPLPVPQFAERNLYLPSAGIAIVVGYGAISAMTAARGRRWVRALVAVAFAGIIGRGIYVSRQRALWYRDQVTLFTQIVRTQPQSALAHFNLAGAYLTGGEAEAAIKEYRRAIRLRPTATAYHGLGDAYMAAGLPTEAAPAYRSALALAPALQMGAGELSAVLDAQRSRAQTGGESTTPNRGLR